MDCPLIKPSPGIKAAAVLWGKEEWLAQVNVLKVGLLILTTVFTKVFF